MSATATAITVGVALFAVVALALRSYLRHQELRGETARQLGYWNTIQRPAGNVIDITPALERRRRSAGGSR